MRKLRFAALAAVMMSAAVSCMNEIDDFGSDVSIDGEVVFTASVPGAETKAVLDGNKSWWQNGDKITVHNGIKGFEFVTSLSENAQKADFSYGGTDFTATDDGVIAVYPAGLVTSADIAKKSVNASVPASQRATAGSYDKDAALAVAFSQTDKLQFRNAVALVKFTVTVPNVKGAVFAGNNGEPVAGNVQVVLNEDNSIGGVTVLPTSVDGAEPALCTEVGLYAEGDGFLTPGATYYIAVAPTTFTKGFALDLVVDGERHRVKNIDKEYIVKPNKILNFGEFEYWSWDDTLADSADDVPTEEEGGWIMITRAEELAALMIYGGKENAKYRIANDLVMKGMPKEVAAKITDGVLFKDITVDGAGYMISDMDLPAARGIFSKVENFTAMNIDIENVSVGSEEAVGNIAGTGVFIGQASGNLSLEGIDISDSEAVAPCKVGSLVGAVYEGTASVSGCSVNGGAVATVWVENVSGQCGGLVGYVGRTDEGTSADRSKTVSLTVSNSTVTGTQVNTQVSSLSRPSGIFIGALNGYDWQESLSVDNCSSNAVLTVDADKGAGAGFSSRYNNACKAEFVDALVNENLLGGQAYCRATVNFDGKPFVPAWDGQRTIKPLAAVEEYDGWSSGTVIYSAEDLASLQGKTITSDNHYLLADVDLGGDGMDGTIGTLDQNRNMIQAGDDDVVFKPIVSISHLNGVKKEKIAVSQSAQSDLTKADNNTIYNCKVVLSKHTGSGAAFIQKTSGTTNHSNLNFKRAYIYNHHDESIPEPTEFQADNGAGNAYAGTLVSVAGGTYNVKNVHAESGHIYAVCKIGGLIGYATAKLDMSGCSVNEYLIENYEANVKNWYPITKDFDVPIISTVTVYANQWWYTQGECGGLIGITYSSSIKVDKCSVTNTRMNCYGQPNKEVTAGVYGKGFNPEEGGSPMAKGYTTVAGRHINQFIGDVRSSEKTDVAEISDYYVSGNTYFNEPAETGNTSNKKPTDSERRHHYKTSGNTYYYCNCVGQAYYVGVDVNVVILQKHVADFAGTLTFNAVGEEPVEVTETSPNGNDVAWTGGDFRM